MQKVPKTTKVDSSFGLTMAPASDIAPSSLLSSRMWLVLQGTFTPFAVRSGLACLAAQCAVFFVLKFLGRHPSTAGPWSRRAGFTAHQVVCVPVLAYLTGTRDFSAWA
jgi:hypothetical protein